MCDSGRPWAEKHRPTSLADVAMNAAGRAIFNTILARRAPEHLLLYGPPGCGKTTAATCLADALRAREPCQTLRAECSIHRSATIHLNASDDRGVDTVRELVKGYACTSGLFTSGLKCVILDEADNMTDRAQEELSSLVSSTDSGRVCFIIICNYLHLINSRLQQVLVPVRFDRPLPEEVETRLNHIARSEGMRLGKGVVGSLARGCGSDMREMVNKMQAHRYASGQWGPCDPEAAWAAMEKAALHGGSVREAFELHYGRGQILAVDAVVRYLICRPRDRSSDSVMALARALASVAEAGDDARVDLFIAAAESIFRSHSAALS